jgi:hypothetical protein
MRKRKVNTKKSILKRVVQSKLFPFVTILCFLGVGFVLTRMKRIEQDYAYNDIQKDYTKVSNKIKELRAKKAEMLSIKNLRGIAKKYNLKEPDYNHIILIP